MKSINFKRIAGMAVIWPALITASVVQAQDTTRYTGPIIDMHLHAYTADDFWGPAPNPATGQILVKSAEAHRKECLEIMKKHNVVLGIASGVTLASAESWAVHAPERILKGIDFSQPNAKAWVDVDQFKAMIQEEKLDVFAELGAQYAGISPSDPVLEPYLAIAEQHGIPVGIHTGASFPGTPYRGFPKFRLRYGDPYLMEDMLVAHPDLKVYIMHAGGQFYKKALAVMAMYPHVYADIGVLTWIPGMDATLEDFLKKAKESRMLDRVMFGSDQMVWPEAIEMSIQRVQSFDFLSREDKANIFYNNAARFLELSEEEIARHYNRGIDKRTTEN